MPVTVCGRRVYVTVQVYLISTQKLILSGLCLRSDRTRYSDMRDTSARALVDHWAWASGKGMLAAPTARALATACRGVLEVQDDWERLDIKTLDIDDALNRFKNLRSRNFKPNSLRDYETRFRRAVQSYLEYLEDQAAWKYPTRTSTRRASRKSSTSSRPNDPDRSPDVAQSSDVSDKLRSDDFQEYVYPFRQDVMARLTIPRDATTAEINRLVAWARTLAVDYEPTS